MKFREEKPQVHCGLTAKTYSPIIITTKDDMALDLSVSCVDFSILNPVGKLMGVNFFFYP